MITSPPSIEGLNTDIDRFDELGYVVVPEVLSREEAQALWAAIEDMPGNRHGGVRLVNERQLLKDPRFFKVVTSPKLVEVARRLVGEDVQALDHVMLETPPGGSPGGEGAERSWHTDFAYVGEPTLVVTANVYLQDLTDESGPLFCIPGTHKERKLGTGEQLSNEPLDEELKISIPAGTAVVFHSNLLHCGSPNRTVRPRRLLFHFYGHFWMKRLDEYYTTPLPDYIRESDDPLVRQLFGIELPMPGVHGKSYNPVTYGG
jgi:ectoine hydroxylase-related dioxygenase (phytanoyl-CoA dioxygenase family)